MYRYTRTPISFCAEVQCVCLHRDFWYERGAQKDWPPSVVLLCSRHFMEEAPRPPLVELLPVQ